MVGRLPWSITRSGWDPRGRGGWGVCPLSPPAAFGRAKFINSPGRVKSCSWLCRAGKERKKADRYALDCQERAYWLVNRTPVSSRCQHVALVPRWWLPCSHCGLCTLLLLLGEQVSPSSTHFSFMAHKGARDWGPAAAPVLRFGGQSSPGALLGA